MVYLSEGSILKFGLIFTKFQAVFLVGQVVNYRNIGNSLFRRKDYIEGSYIEQRQPKHESHKAK